MHKKGLSTPALAHTNPYKFAGHHWTKSMGKPSTHNLRANYNHRSHCYVRR